MKKNVHQNQIGTVWGYFVVSSDKQADSLEDQRTYFEQTVASNNWTVTRVFEGVSSGKDGTRELLETLLGELERTPSPLRPERVWMKRADRLGRGIGLEALAAIAKLHELGVTIHTLQDGDYRLNSVVDLMMPMMRIFAGGIDNENKNMNLRNKYRLKREQGKNVGNQAPYGTRLNKEGRLEPVEPEASIVQKVFEMRASGKGYIGIAREIIKIAPPKTMSDGSLKHFKWAKTTIMDMCAKPGYRGVVVTEELFDHVQTVRNPGTFHAKPTGKYPWPLGGTLYCYCGMRLRAQPVRNPRNRIFRYYKCKNYAKHERWVTWSAPKLEEQFARLITDLRADASLYSQYRVKNGPVDLAEAHRAHIRDLRDQQAAIERRKSAAFDLQADGALSKGDFVARMAKLTAEGDVVQREIVEAERAIDMQGVFEKAAHDAAVVLGQMEEFWLDLHWENQRRVAGLVALACGGLYVDTTGTIKPVNGTDDDEPSGDHHLAVGRVWKQSRTDAKLLANIACIDLTAHA